MRTNSHLTSHCISLSPPSPLPPPAACGKSITYDMVSRSTSSREQNPIPEILGLKILDPAGACIWHAQICTNILFSVFACIWAHICADIYVSAQNMDKWGRGPKSLNFPDGNFQRAKTFRAECVNHFRDKKKHVNRFRDKKNVHKFFL